MVVFSKEQPDIAFVDDLNMKRSFSEIDFKNGDYDPCYMWSRENGWKPWKEISETQRQRRLRKYIAQQEQPDDVEVIEVDQDEPAAKRKRAAARSSQVKREATTYAVAVPVSSPPAAPSVQSPRLSYTQPSATPPVAASGNVSAQAVESLAAAVSNLTIALNREVAARVQLQQQLEEYKANANNI